MYGVLGIIAISLLLWSIGVLATAIGMTITDGRISAGHLLRTFTAAVIAMGAIATLLRYG